MPTDIEPKSQEDFREAKFFTDDDDYAYLSCACYGNFVGHDGLQVDAFARRLVRNPLGARRLQAAASRHRPMVGRSVVGRRRRRIARRRRVAALVFRGATGARLLSVELSVLS